MMMGVKNVKDEDIHIIYGSSSSPSGQVKEAHECQTNVGRRRVTNAYSFTRKTHTVNKKKTKEAQGSFRELASHS